MQPLLNGSEKTHWHNALIDDIAYIKKHLRYRPTLKTLLPTIFRLGFVLLLIIVVSVAFYVDVSTGEKVRHSSIITLSSVFILFAMNIARYLQSLKFISVPTGFHIAENSLLLEQFLKANYLASSRHSQMPEIFQIMSRNLSAGKEDREVVVFIADDKRILINSHFSNRWGFFPSQRHHRQLAAMLQDFLNKSSAGTGLMHQTF